MKKILICAAISGELKIAKKYYKENIYKEFSVDFLEIGIGNYQTILKLTQALSIKKYDFIVNFGVCGYTQNKKNCIQIARCVSGANQRETIIPLFFSFADLESILCSETPVFNSSHIDSELGYVDMESYGVETVCEHFKTPRIILKVPFDKVGEETLHFNKALALETLEKNLDFMGLSQKIITYFSTLPKEINIDQYIEYYNWTFSETHILKKYIHAYSCLADISFHNFFLKNKHKNKKAFLLKLGESIQQKKV